MTYEFDLPDGEEITCCYDCPLCNELINCGLETSIDISELTSDYGHFPDKCQLRVVVYHKEAPLW